MGFHVRLGIGPLRYSAPLTRRRRLTRKEQEAGRNLKVILFLLLVAYCIVALIVKAAIAHPAALFIGCAVAGVVLLGVIRVRERRGMNAKAARFERDALAGAQSEPADSAVIMSDVTSERIINHSAESEELAAINLSAEPGREALIDSVDVEELNDRHGQPAGSKVIPPDAPPLRPLPAKPTESDPVAVAAARVAEKWQQLEQLDSRRVETGADLESEMQGVFQEGLDITTEIFGKISDQVISEVKAGGRRARIGNRALPHVKAAMAAMEAVVASNRKCGIYEGMDKIDAVFGPLYLACACLAASS